MNNNFNKNNITQILRNNAVTITFVILCIVCLVFSGFTVNYLMFELFTRIARNAFIVLALIIPIIAGMGINFAITIGAMAAQIAILWVLEWGVAGFGGFALAVGITIPVAGLFGYLVGLLLTAF